MNSQSDYEKCISPYLRSLAALPVYGVVKDENSGVLAVRMHSESSEQRVAYFLGRNELRQPDPKWGKWASLVGENSNKLWVRPWWPIYMGIAKKPKEQVFALSKMGDVFFYGEGNCGVERITEEHYGNRLFTGAQVVDGELFAVTSSGLVYQRSLHGWVEYFQVDNLGDHTILGLVGLQREKLYLYGSGGAIFHWNGDSTRKLKTISHQNFSAGISLQNGDSYFVGTKSLVCKVIGEEVFYLHGPEGDLCIPQKTSSETGFYEDLWTMTEFQGVIYLSSANQLYTLIQETVSPLSLEIPAQKQPYYLSSSSRCLWSVGLDGAILSFDGKTWQYLDSDVCS